VSAWSRRPLPPQSRDRIELSLEAEVEWNRHARSALDLAREAGLVEAPGGRMVVALGYGPSRSETAPAADAATTPGGVPAPLRADEDSVSVPVGSDGRRLLVCAAPPYPVVDNAHGLDYVRPSDVECGTCGSSAHPMVRRRRCQMYPDPCGMRAPESRLAELAAHWGVGL
jgi:hypothetical protein